MDPLDLPRSFEDAAPKISARLYGEFFHQFRAQRLRAGGRSDAIPTVIPVVDDIVAAVVYDTGRQVIPLTEHLVVDTWSRDIDAVMASATANNRGRETTGVVAAGPGTFVITDEQLAASVLLDATVSDGFPVQGDPVVIAPRADLVVVTGTGDIEAQRRAAAVVDRAIDLDESLVSVTPFVLRGGEWHRYAWPEDPTLDAITGRTERRVLAGWYQQQGDLLRSGRAFPAAATLLEREGETLLNATWNRGVETLLPRTDTVGIIGPDGVEEVVPFEDFLERSGARLTDLRPVRYFVPADAPV